MDLSARVPCAFTVGRGRGRCGFDGDIADVRVWDVRMMVMRVWGGERQRYRYSAIDGQIDRERATQKQRQKQEDCESSPNYDFPKL